MPKGFSKRRNKHLVDFAYFNWDSPAIERQSVRAVSHCDALRAAKSGLRAQGIDESHLRSALVRRHLRRQWKIVSDDYENPNNAAVGHGEGLHTRATRVIDSADCRAR